MKGIAVLLFILVVSTSSFAFGFDWQQLHEQSSDISLKEAGQAVEEDPGSLEDLYVLGLGYLDEYEVEEAEKIFRKMLEIDISNIPAQWGVAECLRRKGDCDICMRLLNEIIAAKPDFAPAYISLAYMKYMQMDFNETVKLAYKVIKLGKENVDLKNFVRAHGLLAGAKGMIAHYGGPLSKVINGRAVMPYLQKAKALDPDSVTVYYGLGSYYLLTPPVFGRDVDKAIEYLKKAVEADSLFADAYVRLAQAYKEQGKLSLYDQYINKAEQIGPNSRLVEDIKSGTCNFICINPD